jgi:hypothetical protein
VSINAKRPNANGLLENCATLSNKSIPGHVQGIVSNWNLLFGTGSIEVRRRPFFLDETVDGRGTARFIFGGSAKPAAD